MISSAQLVDVIYTGDYATFAEAKALSTGRENQVILERTRIALRKVVEGKAAFERDAVTFDKLELPFPLLSILMRAAAENKGHLSVLDFGGALGSTYFLCRSFLGNLPSIEWSIVEQPAHVACGQAEFANDILRFYPTIEACLQERKPTVLLLSGVLQCQPDPWGLLAEAGQHPFDWIVLDRMPIIDAERDRLTIETVSPRIYPASYPSWFFSRKEMTRRLPEGWRSIIEFDALDRQLLDGVELTFKGFVLQRSS